jgi:hypothetical protein
MKVEIERKRVRGKASERRIVARGREIDRANDGEQVAEGARERERERERVSESAREE